MASRGSSSALRVIGASLRSGRSARRVLLVGGVAAVGLVISTDDRISNFQAIRHLRTSLHIKADAGSRPDSTAPKDDAFRVDPDTDVRFPLTLPASSSYPPLHLVGLGVRKVSFLRVKVYSAGFYLEKGQIKGLHHVLGWHNFTAQHLLTPPTTHPSDPLEAPQMTGEALMRSLLDKPIACAVKIVPVRNTDFSHLRDGFTRALVARQKAARTSGSLSDSEDARITESIQSLKSFFPSQKVSKGNSLSLVRTPQSSLLVEYEGRVLGEVRDPWIAREMMLAYFADKDVISPKLKEDVAQGFEKLMKE